MDGKPVNPRPVTKVNCAVEWSIRSVCIDRTKCHLVDYLLKMRQQVRDLTAALAALGERPRAGHDLLRAIQRAPLDLEWRRLSVVLHQHRLRIEHVDRARPAAD